MPRLLVLSLLFAVWLAAASVAVWVWPLLALLALAAGWLLARWCPAGLRHAYPVALGPSFFTALAVLGYLIALPDAHFGTIFGEMAAMQVLCAIGAFAFVRHVLQPAGQ